MVNRVGSYKLPSSQNGVEAMERGCGRRGGEEGAQLRRRSWRHLDVLNIRCFKRFFGLKREVFDSRPTRMACLRPFESFWTIRDNFGPIEKYNCDIL